MINRDTRARAVDLFIDYGYSIEKISEEMKLSEWTVRKWAKTGNWTRLREAAIARRENFIEELRDFIITVGRGMKKDYTEGRGVDISVLKLFDTLAGKVEKIMLLENEKERAKKEDKIEGELPPEVASKPKVVEALRVIAEELEKYENTNRRRKND